MGDPGGQWEASAGFAMGKNEEQDADRRCGGAAPGPGDLASHKAAGQDVYALKDPDEAQDDHEAGEDLEEGADGGGHSGWVPVVRAYAVAFE